VCVIRYFFFMPAATSSVLAEGRRVLLAVWCRHRVLLSKPAKAGWSFALCTIIWGLYACTRTRPGRSWYTSLPIYVALTAIFARAIWFDAATPPRIQVQSPVVRWLVCFTAFHIFAMPILGLADISMNHMYSNTRLYGGSNHFLVPTGLLHALAEWWAAEVADNGVVSYRYSAGLFSGGVVRVDATNSRWINLVYPGDLTVEFEPRVTAWLHEGGHSGRFLSSIAQRVVKSATGLPLLPVARASESQKHFIKYKTTGLEIRRLLAEAKALNEPFSITYTRLPGEARGLRPPMVKPGVTVSYTWYNDENSTCSALQPGMQLSSSCASDELVYLPPPGPLANKLLVYTAHPIFEHDDEDPYCLG